MNLKMRGAFLMFYFSILDFFKIVLSCASKIFRYEDFFGAKKKRVPMKKPKVIDGSEDSDTGDEQEDDKALNNKVVLYIYIYIFSI